MVFKHFPCIYYTMLLLKSPLFISYSSISFVCSRHYVSAIRSAERFAEEHGFPIKRLYTSNAEEAKATADALFANSEFVQCNNDQHNRFRAAIAKLLTFYGSNWSPAVKSVVTHQQKKESSLDAIKLTDSDYTIDYKGKAYVVHLEQGQAGTTITFPNCGTAKDDIKFISLFRSVMPSISNTPQLMMIYI